MSEQIPCGVSVPTIRFSRLCALVWVRGRRHWLNRLAFCALGCRSRRSVDFLGTFLFLDICVCLSLGASPHMIASGYVTRRYTHFTMTKSNIQIYTAPFRRGSKTSSARSVDHTNRFSQRVNGTRSARQVRPTSKSERHQ